MLVCLEIFVLFENFFTHLETSPLQMEGCNFDLCSALLASAQWGFSSVPQLLWHLASVYNCYLRGPLTLHSHLMPSFGNGAVTTYFNDFGLSRLDSNSQPSAFGANFLTNRLRPLGWSGFKFTKGQRKGIHFFTGTDYPWVLGIQC